MKARYLLIAIAAATISLGLGWQPKAEGLKISFGEFVDSRDNHSYQTVKIGKQEWLAENFAYLPYVCPSDSANCGVWVYNYSGTNISQAKETAEYKNYGGLYSWAAAQELAPAGWHLPSDEEWKALETHLGIAASDLDGEAWRGSNNEANRLKEKGDTGLRVTFGGWMTDYGKFNFIEEHAIFSVLPKKIKAGGVNAC